MQKTVQRHAAFQDQRAQAVNQRRLQESMAASSRASGLAAQQKMMEVGSRPGIAQRVVQLAATSISYGNLQKFTFDGTEGWVGTSMAAHLNPTDKKKGSDTAGSNAYNALFNKLQSKTKTTWVRGHLLNHDLGGIANYNNLFPITTAANNEHKYEVEYPVKHWLENGCEIDYNVTAAKSNSGDSDGDGVFVCDAQVTAGASKYQGKRVQKDIYSKTQKVSSTKKYRNKSNQTRNGHVSVGYGLNNNIMRDDYKTHNALKGWEHTSGNSGNNYFIHNNEIFSGSSVQSNEELQQVESDYQSEWLNFTEHFKIGGKKIDGDLINDIMEFVFSEAEGYEEQLKLIKEELEDAGYTLSKR